MKARNTTRLWLGAIALPLTTGCLEPRVQPDPEPEPTVFEVRVENVGRLYRYMASGVFETPQGATMAPLMPGEQRAMQIEAAPGCRLSVVTAVVDDFASPRFAAFDPTGLPLFSTPSTPVTGTVTDALRWWNVESDGTTNHAVPTATDDRANGPASELLDVSVEYHDGHFTVTVTNVSEPGGGTPMVSGVWAIHDASTALFDPTRPLPSELTTLAVHGDPEPLAQAMGRETGVTPIVSAGVRTVHTRAATYFTPGDWASQGLEALAEDGDPTVLAERLSDDFNYTQTLPFGVWRDPDAEVPSGLEPGDVVWFDVEAYAGDRFSIVTADLQTNDMFFGFAGGFVELFDADERPIEGDVTDALIRFDAGTELDQRPGLGADQGARQFVPGQGYAQRSVVEEVPPNTTVYGYDYATPTEMVRVEIWPVD